MTLDQLHVQLRVVVTPPATHDKKKARYEAFVELLSLPLMPGFIKVRHVSGKPTRTVMPEWLSLPPKPKKD